MDELSDIVNSLERAELNSKLASRVAEVITAIQRRKTYPVGATFLVNFKDDKHVMDTGFDIYNYDGYRNRNLLSIYDKSIVSHLTTPLEENGMQTNNSVVDLDGVVLVLGDGQIHGTGYYFLADVRAALHAVNPNPPRVLYQGFGFNKAHGARHISGIATSYHVKDSLVFVLSQDEDKIRVFYEGKILYSPEKNEINYQPKPKQKSEPALQGGTLRPAYTTT